MESPTPKDKRLQEVHSHWNNQSQTSIESPETSNVQLVNENDKYSHQMELHSLKTHFPFTEPHDILPSPKVEGLKMPRKDSVYSEPPSLTHSASSSRRTSTSSSSRRTSPSKSKRRTYQPIATNAYPRPGTKRATRSSPQITQIHSFPCHRPIVSSRHTIPYLTSTPQKNGEAEFFQFPSLPAPDTPPKPVQQQPPPTMQYWTSDNTRRLEYAAIDAASRGLRGFLTKLIPDCMLPKEMKRTKFCDGDDNSDAGSVRRYRLDLPKEDDEDDHDIKKVEESGSGKRSGVFRRWSGGMKSKTT